MVGGEANANEAGTKRPRDEEQTADEPVRSRPRGRSHSRSPSPLPRSSPARALSVSPPRSPSSPLNGMGGVPVDEAAAKGTSKVLSAQASTRQPSIVEAMATETP